jgi:aromatic ring-opening dioxygenase catalytic subunit (LigB family)
MLISPVYLVPHVPTLLVDEHRGHHTEMLEALGEVAQALQESPAAAAVVVSARWQSNGPFLVDDGKRLATITDYSGFGVEVRYECAGAPALARELVAAGTRAGLRVAATRRGADSGVTVPMHFIRPDCGIPVVPLSVADRPLAECHRWGDVIRRVLAARPEPVLFVVGGLLSFDPHAWQLGREVPAQREFDERILHALQNGTWDAIDDERRAVIAAGRRTHGGGVHVEGELRHLEILRGFLGADVCGHVRAYEPGAGAGAALVAFEIPHPEPAPPAPGSADAAGDIAAE